MRKQNDCPQKKLEQILVKYKGKDKDTIKCLHEVQEAFGYIPKEFCGEISHALGVSESDLYGIITFYTQFTLTPKAKYNIDVCMGTACFVNGASDIVDEFEKSLGIKMGTSSSDGMYALTNTRCVGCCGLAPVVTINGEVYGKVTRAKVKEIIEKLK